MQRRVQQGTGVLLAALTIGAAAIAPTEALAQCTAVTASSVDCTGAVVNQGPGPNTGFGSAATGPFTVTVEEGASVTGTNIGINLAAGSTIINSGTITGSGTDALQFHGTGNTLKLTPTSVINGIARGAGSDTFQLGGSGNGSLDVSLINSASQYRGFTTYQKVDDSIWTLTGTTTRVTSWQLLGGTLSVSSNTNLGAGSGTLTFNGGTLQITGTSFTSTPRTIIWGANGGGFDIADANNTFTVNQTLSGVGPLTKLGAGTLVFTGPNTYSGGTAINAGTLRLGVNSVFNTPGDPTSGIVSSAVGTGPVILDGATLQAGINNITLANVIALTNAGGTIDNNNKRLTLAGPILDVVGAQGQLVLTGGFGPGAITILSGSSNYSGGTLISSTTVQVSNSSAIGTGTVTLRDAEFQAGSTGPLTLTNNFAIDDTSFGSAIDNNGRVLTLTGNISDGNGPGALTFSNSNVSGRTVLLGTNTYTGGTTICGCALVQLGDATHTSSLVGDITIEGELDILRADTSKIVNFFNTGGLLSFANNSTASTAAISNTFGGLVQFNNTSTAGGATITNDAGGIVEFNNHSTAGNASITNLPGSQTNFYDNSSAGSSNITNQYGSLTWFFDNSTAGSATITNDSFGSSLPGLGFFDNAMAGTATINNTSNGFIAFGFAFGSDTSSADHATITNDGLIQFNALSNAGFATITTNNAAGVFFFDNTTGSAAQFITNTGGTTDFSQTTGPAGDGRITAGSIAGAGDYYLGGNRLTVGSNNLSTEVSGTINDGVSPLLVTLSGCGCGLTFGTGASLEKVGTGTLILSGINTYSGGTIFTGGTVSVSQEANLGALTGPLTFNGGILQITGTSFTSTSRTITWGASGGGFDIADPNNTFTVSQTLTGGPLTKLGAGTLVLSGPNTYSGGTTVAGGTLAIAADNNIGTGPLTMLNGAILQFIGSFTFTHAVTVAGDPTINVATGNTNTMSGVIADGATPGDIVKTGGGTLILTANNTYTGGTTISAGVLQLGNGGTSGSIVGDVLNNAILAINRSNTVTLAGNMSGTGVLQQNGAGTTIFTGTNTYTGGTTISAGTLQLGNGGAGGSIVGNVLNNAIFAINRSDSYTFGGVISGTGAFQQNGAGNTILTGINTYTGATTVNAGTLSVNGSIASSSGVTVNNGATVGGTGTLPTTTINGGTLAPGNSIGTITVSGNLTFVGAGNYMAEVSPAAADRTNVSGTASLAGTIRLAAIGGTYIIGTRYVLLNAASVSGTFATAAVTGTFGDNVRPDVTYDAANVYLTLDPITTPAPPNATPIPVPQLLPLLPAGTPVNPRNVAAALDPTFSAAGTAPGAFLALFNVSIPGLPGALSQLSGEVGTSAAIVGFQDMGQFLELMLDPFLENRVSGGPATFGGPALAFAPSEGNAGLPDAASAYARMPVKAPPLAPTTFDQRWTVWGAAYGASGSFNGNAAIGSHDLTARSGGFAGGIDDRLGPNTVVGFAASGSSLSYSLDGGLGSGTGDAFKAGVYASTRFDNAYLSASAAYGNYDLSTSRSVILPGVGDHLTGDVTAHSFGGRIEAGYRFPFLTTSGITPYAAFQAQSFHLPGYGEADATGLAAFALAYNGHTFDEERSELGARFDSRLAVSDNSILLLRGRLAWAHEFSGNPSLDAAFVTLPGAAFTVTGAGLPRDALLVSAGPELRLPNGWSLRAKFDGTFSGQSQTYAGTGALRFTW